ncbi:hypothetical protein COT49_02025 [candidate division WWE3 bacterium CG08_land_8_20_14_0_20_40_13]|uniref:Glycosyltransferase RgtA/B/C/D-like domain-containing protein n=1 Tax=candidate division WWE3 bacterium CG08_land_8_20_14_0_20_40_13 TaxID=1975084 RepID=A0A2H0XDS3_UNCKA|nr:MAG: hypothetical protein COT49_02025 [candidate division WWE3 bacterium CG08_land_8_20_14_0_20_40_13]
MRAVVCVVFFSITGPLIFFFSPLWGTHAGNSADRGYAGFKLATEGFVKHRLGHYLGFGGYYTNHPPVAHLLTGISFKIIGDNDLANRIPPYLFSVAGAILFYLLIKELFDKKTALISSLFYISTPVYIYYGSINIHENYSVSLLLASCFFYSRFLKERKEAYLLGSTFCVLGSALSSWHVWFFYLILAILGRKEKTTTLLFVVATLGAFFSMEINTYTAQKSFLTNSIGSFLFRTGLDNNTYSLLNNPLHVAGRLLINISISLGIFTIPAIVYWGISQSACWRRVVPHIKNTLFLFPILPIIIFSNAFYIHEYLFIYALPASALAEGFLLLKLWRMKPFVTLFIFAHLMWVVICLGGYIKPVYKDAYLLGTYIRENYPNQRGILYVLDGHSNYSERILSYYARKDVLVAKSCDNPQEKVDLAVYSKTVVCDSAEKSSSTTIGNFVVAKIR